MSSDVVIEIKDLSYTYRLTEKEVLKDINLEVRRGEVVGIVGPTGAGKTTLCMTINGLIPHSITGGKLEGEVKVLGMNTKEHTLPEIARKVGMVFQDPESQIFGLTVLEDVVFLPENLGLPEEEIERRLKWALNAVRLSGYEERFPYQLSGGEKQRLAIASLLSGLPEILILDEPTSELDPIGKMEVFDVLERLKKEMKITLIIVEHNTEQLSRICDRIIVLDKGQIVLAGNPKEVFSEVRFLQKIGVRPPQTAELGELLKNTEYFKEYDHPLTVEDAVQRLLRIFQKRKQKKAPATLNPSQGQKPGNGEAVIEAENLWYIYESESGERKIALKNINLRIRKGDFVALIGHNGSGKTTLAKNFVGLLRPTKGKVLIYGKDASTMSVKDIARKIGYCFQNPDHQIFSKTVKEEIMFGPKNLGFSEDQIEQIVKKVLKIVGLEGYEDEDPFFLGKGERQKIAVASILAMNPEVLIVDEPTTGMDWKTSISMMRLLKNLNEMGHTIIFITHDMDIVAEYAKRIIVLKEGEILIDGPTREVFTKMDLLRKAFLLPPQITRVAYELDEYLPPDILTTDEAYEAIVKSLGG